MQTPFPISFYDSTMAPPSIIEKLKLQSPYYNFSEIRSQNLLKGLPSLLKCPKYLLEDFKKYISQFSLKYLGDDSEEIVEQILLKGSRLDMEIQGRKGMRQLAAAIVLGEFSDKIRIRIKEYAALNNLYCTTLTKNYIKYQKVKKYQSSFNESNSQEVKVIEQDSFPQITCKLSQVTCKLEPIQEEKIHHQKKGKAEVESVKQAIQFIYDKIFKSSKMQENRRQIINKMNERIYQSIDDIEYHLQIGKKSPSRLFAIVFTFIRSMGISYPLAKFNEGIKFATGYTVKYEEVLKVKTVCSLGCKKKSPINFQVKLQDDSSNFLLMQNHFFA